MSGDQDLRRTLIATAREMNRQGLNQGTSGNLSVRVNGGMLITPSALAYDACSPEDVVFMSAEGEIRGERKPSSEWRLHRDIYRRYPEAGAILHAHSVFSTTLACLQRAIPAFHYMVAVAGGHSIRCAPYATFGSQALSDAAVAALDGRRAALLAHHGMICHGESPAAALALAVEIEVLSRIYVQTLQVAAEPPLLADKEMDRVLAAFREYRP